MNKKILLKYTLAAVVCLTPISAYAAWTVFDPSAVAKLGEQLKKAQEQIKELQGLKKELENQAKAIGSATQIQIPSITLDKLTGSLKETLECTLLNPDEFKDMFPSLNVKNIRPRSVCNGDGFYQDILQGTPQDFENLSSTQRDRLASIIRGRRVKLVNKMTTKSLAFADKQLQDANLLSDAAAELKHEADTVKPIQDRLAVLAAIQLLSVKGQIQTNQLLAMILKLKASELSTHLPETTTLKIQNEKN